MFTAPPVKVQKWIKKMSKKEKEEFFGDMCGETRCCFDEETGEYIGPPSPLPVIIGFAVIFVLILIFAGN